MRAPTTIFACTVLAGTCVSAPTVVVRDGCIASIVTVNDFRLSLSPYQDQSSTVQGVAFTISPENVACSGFNFTLPSTFLKCDNNSGWFFALSETPPPVFGYDCHLFHEAVDGR
jgi:hypothetical protein